MANHNFHPKYRPDIDGLRALAILPVVAYHAFPSYIPGGFIGVDIFFVISGYLISLIIFRSLSNNNFSFAEFYAHRVKRIFPALILVTATCYVIGWFTLLPDEFRQLGKHIASGIGFAQNFILWKEAGYFDISSELKPLMHLWSLAVEEQFYLIFPLLVWIAWKAKLNILTCVMLLGGISFILNLKGVDKNLTKTFFMPQTRFWELIAGSVLAYIYSFNTWRPSFTHWIHTGIFNHFIFRKVPEEQDRDDFLSSILSFLGLALIIYSIAKYNHTMPYPGMHAASPVLGAILLILAGPRAWVNRQILSRKIIIWIGLISYPLYLWHWPLLSFARIVESETPSLNIRAAAIVISFILATLTYYLIEKRVHHSRSTWRKVAILSALAMLVGYTGYNAYTRDGLKFRDAAKIAELNKFDYPYRNSCNSITGEVYGDDWCNMTPMKHATPNALLMGDSFSNAYSEVLKEFARKHNEFSPIQIGRGQCPMLLDYGPEYCKKITSVAIKLVSDNPAIKTVIFGSNWPLYSKGKDFHWVKHIETEEQFLISLEKTIHHYRNAGKNIAFLLAPPQGTNPRSCIVRPIRITNKNTCNFTSANAAKNDGEYKEKLINLLLENDIQYFDPFPILCPNENCIIIDKNRILWSDSDHMSQYGGQFLARHSNDALFKIFIANRK